MKRTRDYKEPSGSKTKKARMTQADRNALIAAGQLAGRLPNLPAKFIGPMNRPVGYVQPANYFQAHSPEIKGMDTNIGTSGTAVVDTTGTNGNILVLNLMRQGAASENRVGRKVNLATLALRCMIQFATTTSAAAPSALDVGCLRIAVVWDNQPGATIPNFDDIFGRTTQDGSNSVSVLDPLRYQNVDRFKVLRDYYIDASSMSVNQTPVLGSASIYTKFIRDFIKLNDIESIYTGTASPMTIANISTGALYIIFRATDTGDAGEWFIDDASMARLRYVDT